MGELKSVKVDNWGVFFLQKLQNFFNKTDYCDLTLQFNDNSQLKVHRLVLSACTDYFNVLESSCEMIEDVLIMPRDLQADVVVPIVNFMYTGTLEFEVNMYDRLLKTAKDMNMSVLLKLLEAHKRTVASKATPVLLNRNIRMASSRVHQVRHAERTYASPNASQRPRQTQQHSHSSYRGASSSGTSSSTAGNQNVAKTTIPEPVALVSKYQHVETKRGPSRFEPVDEAVLPESFETSFNPISYESKPLITAEQMCRDDDQHHEQQPAMTPLRRQPRVATSTFEQLRKGYINPNKRPATITRIGQSPPTKKPNLQEIKEYTEAHRQRKQLAAAEADDDDPDYDSMGETPPFDDDEDDVPLFTMKKQAAAAAAEVKSTHREGAKQISSSVAKSYGGKVSSIRQTTMSGDSGTKSNADSSDKSTVVIKDGTGSVNHAKIISEVLKKYPHLVKNNKNIKLKIMQKSSPPPQPTQPPQPAKQPTPAPVRKPPTPMTTTSAPPTSTQPRKIDSKTMHALIAKGAENMTGPWLCLRCGVDGRPIAIPSYKNFRRHLVNVHRENIDPRICEHCGLRVSRRIEMIYHCYVEHKIRPPREVVFHNCMKCDHVAIDETALKKHRLEKHAPPVQPRRQQCIYCSKLFGHEDQLYTHMRNLHRERACADGILDMSEEEQMFDDNDQEDYDDDEDDQHDEEMDEDEEIDEEEDDEELDDDEDDDENEDKYVPNNPHLARASKRKPAITTTATATSTSASTSVTTSAGGENSKIKILSNISLPAKSVSYVLDPTAPHVSQIGGKNEPTALSASSSANTSAASDMGANMNLEPSSEAEALSNVASGIATSLGLVTTDDEHYEEAAAAAAAATSGNGGNAGGNRDLSNHFIEAAMADVHGDTTAHTGMTTWKSGNDLAELTASQKAEIMSQLEVDGTDLSGNVVMVLNHDDSNFDGAATQAMMTSGDENVVVVYNPTTDAVIKQESSSTKEAEEDQNRPFEESAVKAGVKIEAENVTVPGVKLEEPSKSKTSASESTTNKSGGNETKSVEIKKKEQSIKEESDKLKLISALEGDWSEDEEALGAEEAEEDADLKPEKTCSELNESLSQNAEILFEVTTRHPGDEPWISNKSANGKKDEKTDEAAASNKTTVADEKAQPKKKAADDEKMETSSSGEGLSTLLDEWNDNDSQNSQASTKEVGAKVKEAIKVEDEEEDKEEETAPVSTAQVRVTRSRETGRKHSRDSDKPDTSSTGGKEKKASTAVPVKTNVELKTLINDWGDDDDTEL